jgi:hypothetical protein
VVLDSESAAMLKPAGGERNFIIALTYSGKLGMQRQPVQLAEKKGKCFSVGLVTKVGLPGIEWAISPHYNAEKPADAGF